MMPNMICGVEIPDEAETVEQITAVLNQSPFVKAKAIDRRTVRVEYQPPADCGEIDMKLTIGPGDA